MPPAELIVKFVSGSEASQAAANAMQTGVTENQPLQDVVDNLSTQMGIPLLVRQITSGQEVVLSIDTEKLIPELMERLRQRADVEYVQANTLMQPLSK